IVDAVRRKSGDNYILVITADHGMPPGDRQTAASRRLVADRIKDSLNGSRKTWPIVLYEGENAQIYVKDTLAVRDTIDVLARSLEAMGFAVFLRDSVSAAADTLH